MKTALAAWGRDDFETILKESVIRLDSDALPLQEDLAAGSCALYPPSEVIVIRTEDSSEAIHARLGIFYRSLMPGCACAGDPTVEDEQNEYCVVQLNIDKKTANAVVELLAE